MKNILLLVVALVGSLGAGFSAGYLVSEKKHKNDVQLGRTLQVWDETAKVVEGIAKKYDKKNSKEEES